MDNVSKLDIQREKFNGCSAQDISAAPPGFRFGGNTLGGRPRRGSGGQIFSKFFKNFLKEIAKNALFYHISQQNLSNPAVMFRQF